MEARDTAPLQRADGALVTHLQLAESGGNPGPKRAEVRMIYHGGWADDPHSAERRRQLARRLLTRCAPEEIVAQAPQWRVLEAWPLGALYILEAIWPRLGLDAVIAPPLADHQGDWAVDRALLAMVANRAGAPRSTRSWADQWRREEVRMDGTETRARPHLSRALDGLEAHQETIAQALEVRLAALLNREVERMFYDTTSLPVDLEASAWGVGAEACVEGRLGAGAKISQAPRTRGLSQNGRGDAPPLVVGVAVTREGLPVRPWGFPGTTVDVSTVAPVHADLRGWQLSRCGLGGDAGMGSQEPLPPLSANGGS